MTLTFLFVYCFLFVNFYSKILLQLCQLYSTGHFLAELLFGKECNGSTELVHKDKNCIANKIHDVKGGRGGGPALNVTMTLIFPKIGWTCPLRGILLCMLLFIHLCKYLFYLFIRKS